ncbi:MAG: (2Fe-2S)-binding protein [Candidatus Neomarinimicrobiota bacterium]
MAKISFVVNGQARTLEVDPQMKLLWALRDDLGLTGTKYSCGKGLCGCCTVLMDGKAVRSCITTVEKAAGKEITTIEGLSTNLNHPLQQAWLEEEVSQCGYCQPGQIMNAAALLKEIPHPADADIDRAMNRNLCRCGTYQRVRRAIHRAAGEVTNE